MGIEGLANLTLELGHLFKQVLPQQYSMVVRKISFECYNGVVMKTPVKHGRARGNWGVCINKPYDIVTDVTDKAEFGSAPSSALAATALSTIGQAKLTDAIYITNALPYILPLEEGHSKQGAHMVELTVNEIKQHYGV